MTSGTAVVQSGTRRLHNASHTSASSANHHGTPGDATSSNDAMSSPTTSVTPLITIIYSKASLSHAETRKQTVSDNCTLIRLIYGDNQQMLINSYASCRRLLDHMKQIVGIQHEETIDVMDNDGKLKELNVHSDDYATDFLIARNTYYILKVEVDGATGEKRYTPSFNLDQIEQKLSTVLANALNTLNKSVNKSKRGVGSLRQNTALQTALNTPQSKTKRTLNRK